MSGRRQAEAGETSACVQHGAAGGGCRRVVGGGAGKAKAHPFGWWVTPRKVLVPRAKPWLWRRTAITSSSRLTCGYGKTAQRADASGRASSRQWWAVAGGNGVLLTKKKATATQHKLDTHHRRSSMDKDFAFLHSTRTRTVSR